MKRRTLESLNAVRPEVAAMRRLIFSAVLMAAASASAVAAPALLDRAKVDTLNALPVGSRVVIESFPDGFGGQSSLTFERVDVYARGARVIVADASGEHEVPRSARVELIGKNASGDVRVSLAFDPGVVNVSGVGTSASGTFVVSAERSANGLALRAVPVESTYPPGVVPTVLGTDDALPSGRPDPTALQIALTGEAPAGSLRYAVVAVDTDNEFMSERFTNSTSAASSWIADLFATMNVMYERDLNVMLLQGTTILRTATDPYNQDDTPADGTDLDEFGTYWQANYASTPRAFAMLLSGKSSSGNSASGIAWIQAYCEAQSQGGSYSVNQIFTNPQVDVSLSARIVGHELGHNFGAYHTHCTNAASGGAPTATNTIDQCFNGEAGSGCYSGAVSCPTAGPGHPLGTLMSYCNQGHPTGTPPNGANCGQNVLQFHPTQVTVLNSLIAQNMSCLSTTNGDVIFRGTFEH
jgi:metallopeptidase family M12-like protein